MAGWNVLLVAGTDALAGPVSARLFDAGHRVRVVRSPRLDEIAAADVVVIEGDGELAPVVLHAATSGATDRRVILLLWRGAGLPDGVFATLPAADAAEHLVPLLGSLEPPHHDEACAAAG